MLTVIARPTVDPAKLADVKEAMLELVTASRKEAGCLLYELHQDNEHSNRFTFIELWSNREAWQTHMQNEAITAFNKKISGAIINFELQEMTKIA
ncbi:putative quinol monooxygenase [Planctobacterium marinum]|uniref:putative quinol monooxygenase n=1 Tax=Planctobacterium marinum TaxID=1631968 RepID=UPI001E5A4559|nr:putative quinol monooxygenase [Planctobacterium marinum]MCC2605078.1 antibiotic biosynthesis monooxygenase [Planctobacterium marinum]